MLPRYYLAAVLSFLLGMTPVFAQSASPSPSPSPTPPPAARTAPRNDSDLPRPTPGVKPTMPPSTANRRPDLFAPLPYYERANNYFFQGIMDLRYRTLSTSGSKETIGTYIAATRFTADYIKADPTTGQERGGARVQLVLEDDQRGTSLDNARLSEVYAFYRFTFPGVSANVRVGQFVLPFGLLAIYDTPLQPIQPLYEKSLGLRVDTGVMIEGEYSLYHYAASLTTGAGPNRRDGDNNQVITFRLDRTFPSPFGQFQIGGSMMTGNGPITNFDTELAPSGFSGARGREQYVKKTRFAADGVYYYKQFTGRAEVVFGGDDQEPVWGYFGEANYQVSPSITAVYFAKRWNFPNRPENIGVIGIGANITIYRGFTVRGLFEYERDVPASGSTDQIIKRRLTLQTRITF